MTLSPLGDSALVLSVGEEVDELTLARAISVADALRSARLAGIMDVVPAFATVTVYYDIARTGPYVAFVRRLADLAGKAAGATVRAPVTPVITLPVCYGGEYGPDLEIVASRAGAGLDEVIELHSRPEYRVHAVGFVPGFAYLGGLVQKLETPRRSTPRPRVPPGSVGIGGNQTGVYPIATPGGWNLIGRTPLVMFDAGRTPPALLHSGDRVRFQAITPEEFAAWK